MIRKVGISLKAFQLLSNSWFRHWLGIWFDSWQSTNKPSFLFLKWTNGRSVFFRRMKIKRTVSQKADLMKGWGHSLEVGRNGCLWCRKTTVKHNVCRGGKKSLLSVSDERFTPVLSQTHTFGSVLCLHSPSLYQTFLCLAVIYFTQFSLRPLFPFIPSFCMLGKWKQRGGIRWLNCYLFMQSPRVNKDRSCVKWILHLAVTERMERRVENPWDATQSCTRSCHVFLPFRPKYKPSQQP